MTVTDVIHNRNIEEVVHFTTHMGLIGILNSKFLKARSLLSEDQSLEFILKLNSKFRSDPEWIGYVNLSITRVNTSFFGYCINWHRDTHWCALCFSSSILADDGVFFASTNNIYRGSVIRNIGAEGLEYLFSSRILGKNNSWVERSPDKGLNLTTDIEAEVLYPEKVSINNLTRIVVRDEEGADAVSGITHALGLGDIDVVIDEAFFTGGSF